MRPIVIIGQLVCLLVVLKPNAHWEKIKGLNYNRHTQTTHNSICV